MNSATNRYIMNIGFDLFIYFVFLKMLITSNSSEIFLQKRNPCSTTNTKYVFQDIDV